MRILSRQILINTEWSYSFQSPRLATPTPWRRITYGNGTFLTKCGHYLSRSEDGLNWSVPSYVVHTDFSNANYLAYGNGVFVALGMNGSDELYISTDAINWTKPSGSSISKIYSNSIIDLIFDGAKFVALDEAGDGNGCVWTSTDGINWAEKSLETGDLSGARRIASDGNKYVVTRVQIPGDFYISISTDLKNWTEIQPAEFSKTLLLNMYLGFDGSRFFGVSREKITYSTDGANWTTPEMNINLGSHDWRGSANNGFKIVLISSDGYISTKRV